MFGGTSASAFGGFGGSTWGSSAKPTTTAESGPDSTNATKPISNANANASGIPDWAPSNNASSGQQPPVVPTTGAAWQQGTGTAATSQIDASKISGSHLDPNSAAFQAPNYVPDGGNINGRPPPPPPGMGDGGSHLYPLANPTYGTPQQWAPQQPYQAQGPQGPQGLSRQLQQMNLGMQQQQQQQQQQQSVGVGQPTQQNMYAPQQPYAHQQYMPQQGNSAQNSSDFNSPEFVAYMEQQKQLWLQQQQGQQNHQMGNAHIKSRQMNYIPNNNMYKQNFQQQPPQQQQQPPPQQQQQQQQQILPQHSQMGGSLDQAPQQPKRAQSTPPEGGSAVIESKMEALEVPSFNKSLEAQQQASNLLGVSPPTTPPNEKEETSGSTTTNKATSNTAKNVTTTETTQQVPRGWASIAKNGAAGSPDSVKQAPRSSPTTTLPDNAKPDEAIEAPPDMRYSTDRRDRGRDSKNLPKAKKLPAWGGAGNNGVNSGGRNGNGNGRNGNSRGRNGNGAPRRANNDGTPRYYQVMFKKPRQEIFVGYDDRFKIGEYVKVEADRGEDLGKLVAIWSSEKFNNWLKSGGHNERSLSKFHKRMLRLANQEELDMMIQKSADEEIALEHCRQKATVRKLPMVLVGAEYQYDRHKLTFYFEADRRIDFRELVRDLFSVYKTRIWLQQLSQVNRGMPLENQKR